MGPSMRFGLSVRERNRPEDTLAATVNNPSAICPHLNIVVSRTIYSLLAFDRPAARRWPGNGEENCIDVYRLL